MDKNSSEGLEKFATDFGRILFQHQRDMAEVLVTEGVDQDAQDFADFLRVARSSANLTPTELANKANVPEAVVYALERGLIYSKTIEVEYLQRLAKALDEDLETFGLMLDRDLSASNSLSVKVKENLQAINGYLGSGFQTALLLGLMLIAFFALFSIHPASDVESETSIIANNTALSVQIIGYSMIMTLLLLLFWLLVKNRDLPTLIEIRIAKWQKWLVYGTPFLLICMFGIGLISNGNKNKSADNNMDQLNSHRAMGQTIDDDEYVRLEILANNLALSYKENLAEPQLFYELGISYDLQGSYSEALAAYEQALILDRQTTIDNRIRVRVLEIEEKVFFEKNISATHYMPRNYKKALVAYENASISDHQITIDDKTSESNILNNIGTIYYMQEDYQKALTNYDQVREINTYIKKLDQRTPVVWGDLDGDDDLDAAFQRSSRVKTTGNCEVCTDQRSKNHNSLNHLVKFKDSDNDGDLDIIASELDREISWWKNDGDDWREQRITVNSDENMISIKSDVPDQSRITSVLLENREGDGSSWNTIRYTLKNEWLSKVIRWLTISELILLSILFFTIILIMAKRGKIIQSLSKNSRMVTFSWSSGYALLSLLLFYSQVLAG